MMTCEEMLELVRKDRPYQKIHRVVSFYEITPGNYNVSVMMELRVSDGQTEITKCDIIYPMLKPGTNVLNLPHYN